MLRFWNYTFILKLCVNFLYLTVFFCDTIIIKSMLLLDHFLMVSFACSNFLAYSDSIDDCDPIDIRDTYRPGLLTVPPAPPMSTLVLPVSALPGAMSSAGPAVAPAQIYSGPIGKWAAWAVLMCYLKCSRRSKLMCLG